MEAIAAAATTAIDEDDDGRPRLEEAEKRGRWVEALEREGREECSDGGTSTSNHAVPSCRPLPLSTAAPGDPVTREWEELPSGELIFGSPNQVTSNNPGGNRAASTIRVLSPRSIIQNLFRRSRHRPQPQPAAQLSPLSGASLTGSQPHHFGGQPPPPEPSQPTSEEFRSHAIDTLVEKVHRDLEAMGQATEEEAHALLALQAELIQKGEAIESALRAFQEEKEELEQKTRVVLENIHALEEWGRKNGSGKTPDDGGVDVDTVFVPRDGLSAEFLGCRSVDWTVEDLDRHLEKAVQRGALPFRLYLENVRALARRQFFVRVSTVMLEIVERLLLREAELEEEMGQQPL